MDHVGTRDRGKAFILIALIIEMSTMVFVRCIIPGKIVCIRSVRILYGRIIPFLIKEGFVISFVIPFIFVREGRERGSS